MRNYYIIQEKIANYTYVDVYEEYDIYTMKKFLKALKLKYPFKKYRLVMIKGVK